MHKIEKKSYGFRLTFTDAVSAEEMKQWVEDSKAALKGNAGSFGVFVDMRTLRPLSHDAQTFLKTGQKLYKDKGLQRSVVVLNSAVLTMQFKRLAKETGIYAWERYIDASTHPDWEELGIKWIENEIDPD
ncbi:hypothetical protein KAR48_14975 [bacterium]|nr:hypothetical protein [bacterium]